jgi:pimeloyl-ACP methyl ester carboxylesterase
MRWQIPVFFINGRYDWQVNNQVAYEYYEAIEAPLKRFFYIEKSSHAAMVEQPEEFARILIEEIRPLAFAGSAGSSE